MTIGERIGWTRKRASDHEYAGALRDDMLRRIELGRRIEVAEGRLLSAQRHGSRRQVRAARRELRALRQCARDMRITRG